MDKRLILNSLPASTLAFMCDSLSMYLLGNFTQVDLTYQIYVSSFIRIFVAFVGHILWTFRRTGIPIWKKAIKFFPWEIFSVIIVSETLLFINNIIEGSLKDMTQKEIDRKGFLRYLVEKRDGKNTIKTSVYIVLKQILNILFYILVDMRVYKYIFK